MHSEKWPPITTCSARAHHKSQTSLDDCILDVFRTKLKHNAAFLQLPIGLQADHKGVVDLIDRKALYFGDPMG